MTYTAFSQSDRLMKSGVETYYHVTRSRLLIIAFQ